MTLDFDGDPLTLNTSPETIDSIPNLHGDVRAPAEAFPNLFLPRCIECRAV